MKKLLIFLLLTMPLLAADKDWKTGHVISFNHKYWTSGSGSRSTTGHVDENGNFYGSSTGDSWNHETIYLALEDSDFIYYAERTLSFRWQHEPRITENAEIKWNLDGGHLTVLDDRGREFKMHLAKKRKK